MSGTTATLLERSPRTAPRAAPEGGAAFTWAVTAVCAFIVAGLFLDGWAHSHRLLDISLLNPADLSEAYSPPGLPASLAVRHLPYLGGVLLAALLLTGAAAARRSRGAAWRETLPPGYGPGAAGLLLIAAGVVWEAFWPPIYRDASNLALGTSALAALLSPQRLLHLVGLALVLAAPAVAAARREGVLSRPPRAGLPVLLSLTFLLALLSYATQFAHPLVDPWPSQAYWWRSLTSYRYGEFILGESMGVLSIMVQSALMMGILLPALRRWTFPPGGLVLMLGLSALLMASLEGYWGLALAGVAAGAAGDVLLRAVQRSGREWEFRVFAFAVPAIYFAFYFVALARVARISPSWGTLARLATPLPMEGLAWNVQVISGAVFLAGLVGWLVSVLVLPLGPFRRSLE